jgi:hypothetical protein
MNLGTMNLGTTNPAQSYIVGASLPDAMPAASASSSTFDAGSHTSNRSLSQLRGTAFSTTVRQRAVSVQLGDHAFRHALFALPVLGSFSGSRRALPLRSDTPSAAVWHNASASASASAHPARPIPTPARSSTALPVVSTLSVTGEEALDLLGDTASFPGLRRLALTHSDDDTLVSLADILQSRPQWTIKLILDQDQSNTFTAKGLAAISAVAFSKIVLRNIAIGAAEAESLAYSQSPVSIIDSATHARPTAECDPVAVSRISSLTAFDTQQCISDAAAVAFRSHAHLTNLSIHSTGSAAGTAALAASRTLNALTLRWQAKRLLSTEAFAAIADNKAIASLKIGSIWGDHVPTACVEILSRNTTLTALHIHTTGSASLRHLSAMRSLEVLDIRLDRSTVVNDEDARRIAEKPLRSLAFYESQFTGSAITIAASGKAPTMKFKYCSPFSEVFIDALLTNPTLTSLSIYGWYGHDMAPALALKPGLDYLQLTHLRSEEQANVARAWEAAGKPAKNLSFALNPTPEAETAID